MYKKIIILYIAQIYKALLPLAFVPLIIKGIGGEKYGMISFFTMLLGWLGILDIGISSTFIKIVATNKENKYTFEKVCQLFFKISLWYITVSVILIVATFFYSDYFVTKWLRTNINTSEAKVCIKIIGVAIALNYLKAYVSSFLSGMEKQHILAGWSIIASTVLYTGSYIATSLRENALINYFYAITIIAALDLSVITLMVFSTIKKNNKIINIKNQSAPKKINDSLNIYSILRFSLQLSGLSIIWVAATQIDKLILSRYIALNDYANYQIATQLSMIISIFSGPLSQYLMPRLSALYREKKYSEFIQRITESFLLFILLIGPTPIYFFTLGDTLVSLWIKNQHIGNEISNYAKWLIAASYISALMNFVFILLYTLGRLKQHFYVYALYSIITIPISITVAKYWGADASAQLNFFLSFLFMLTWGIFCIHRILGGVLPIITSASFFVSTVSFSIFYLFTLIPSNGFYSILLTKIIAPPIANIIIITLLLWPIREKLRLIMRRCTIKEI